MKNMTSSALFSSLVVEVDGCFGDAFLILRKDLVCFGKRTGVASIKTLIVSELFSLFMAG